MKKLFRRLLGPTIDEVIGSTIKEIDQERYDKYHNDNSWGR